MRRLQTYMLLGGVLAPIVYVIAVVLGGFLQPGYSHASQFVSELIMVDAPNKQLLDALFVVYNLLTILFGLGLVRLMIQEITATVTKAESNNTITTSTMCTKSNRNGIRGALTLVAVGVLGCVMTFFPQDPVGASITWTGMIHIILAGLLSLATMFSMLWIGLWFQKQPVLHIYSLYTFQSVLFVFLSGGLAAFMAVNRIPFSGIMERLTICGFLQWLFVIGLKLFSSTDLAIDHLQKHQHAE